MSANVCGERVRNGRESEKRIEAAGWGLFFVWIGVAIFLDVGWGAALVGIGIIMLLGQAARRHFGVKTDAFPIICGSFLVLGGLWALSAVQLRLAPVLCVAAGLALLASAVVRKARG